MLAAVLFLAALAPANDEQWLQLKARIEAAPQDVATFIERRTGCNYWYGEVTGRGDGRDQSIRKQLRKLRCDTIGRDERALRKRHARSPAVLKLLNETTELDPW
jgi:hypothetical protein